MGHMWSESNKDYRYCMGCGIHFTAITYLSNCPPWESKAESKLVLEAEEVKALKEIKNILVDVLYLIASQQPLVSYYLLVGKAYLLLKQFIQKHEGSAE